MKQPVRMNGYARDELVGHSIDILNVNYWFHQQSETAYMEQLREAAMLSLKHFIVTRMV